MEMGTVMEMEMGTETETETGIIHPQILRQQIQQI